MKNKSPIFPHRVRRISGSFSWLDHQLLHRGFLKRMEPDDMLLYFFLVLVGDKNGVSFYSYDRILDILKMTLDQFITARNRLVNMSLIAIQDYRYQVLELPAEPCCSDSKRNQTVLSLKEIFQKAVEDIS